MTKRSWGLRRQWSRYGKVSCPRCAYDIENDEDFCWFCRWDLRKKSGVCDICGLTIDIEKGCETCSPKEDEDE